MAGHFRSRKARLAALTAERRGTGQTWAEIAEVITRQERVNARVAMRMAHGFTQSEVARLWNERWPPTTGSSGITDKNISYWETWPESGHEPSLATLKRLARLYQCDVGDLIDGGSFTHLDAAQVHRVEVPVGRELVRTGRAVDRQAAIDDLAPLSFVLGSWPSEAIQPTSAQLVQLLHTAQQPDRSPRERETLYEGLVEVLKTWADDTMQRRELLKVLAWAATAAASPGLSAGEQERIVRVLGGRHRVDDTTVGHIESVLHSAMRQDDALGPGAVLETVLAQRNLVRALLPDCASSLRPRLLSLFANISRFAGWLSFDLGDLDSAAYYYEQARTAAHAAENTDLSIFVLCNLSHLATWRGQPRVGIDHAVAASSWARETDDPLLAAYVADVTARAYASVGRHHACLEALDSIPARLGDSETRTPASSLVYFYGLSQHAVTRARCMLLLRDTPRAQEAARQAVALVDPSFVRNHAFGLLHLGTAYLQAKEIEEATKVIGQAADLAARTQSSRLVTLMLRTCQAFGPWQHTAAVKNLDERLTAYGWAPSSMA